MAAREGMSGSGRRGGIKRTCPECGEPYEVKDRKCPSCGAPVGRARFRQPPKKGSALKKIFIALIILIVLAAGAIVALNRYRPEWLPENLRIPLFQKSTPPAEEQEKEGEAEEAAEGSASVEPALGETAAEEEEDLGEAESARDFKIPGLDEPEAPTSLGGSEEKPKLDVPEAAGGIEE
jgi:uncharacterized protein (DUF983 family)